MLKSYDLYYDECMEWKHVELDNVQTHYIINECGIVINTISGKIKKTSINADGYETVNLSFRGVNYTKYIHRLIMELFYPLRLIDENEVNHRDGDKSHNISSNLEWVTSTENQQHAINMGLTSNQIGENNNFSKYTEVQIREACRLMEKGNTREQIAEITGINKGSLQNILHQNGQWRHVTNDYVFPTRLYNSKTFDESTCVKIVSLIENGNTPKVICGILGIGWCDSNEEAIKTLRKTLKRRKEICHAQVC